VVTGRKVVTCAHVIADSGAAPVTVTFPHEAGAVAEPARVVSHGGWAGRPTDLPAPCARPGPHATRTP
jgi:hypothetical protein